MSLSAHTKPNTCLCPYKSSYNSFWEGICGKFPPKKGKVEGGGEGDVVISVVMKKIKINKIQRNNIPKIFPWKRMPHKELLKDLNMIGPKEKLREDNYIPTYDGCP